MDLSSLPPLHGQTALKDARSSLEFRETFGIPRFESISDRESPEEHRERHFDENDGEEAVKCLRRSFQVLNPGNHISKRCPEHGSISFIHCRNATQLGKRYLQLRQVMEERARIDLLRDCLYRVKVATSFIRDLQAVVMEEYRTLHVITHDCIQEVPVSKLYCLNALCEDLRTHIGHWNCIKQKMHTNRWLQPILGSLYFQLDKVRISLNMLRDKALWWLEKLILVGLQVFAHGNVDGITHEMIWNLTRGLEDMNNILNGLQSGYRNSTLRTCIGSVLRLKQLGFALLDPVLTNSVSNIGENVKAIPFTRVLDILANERSKYAALETHRFFTTNNEFVKLLHSGKLPNYVWSEDVSSNADRQDRDTSDYHTATGSMTSLSAAVLKIGSIRAPDLSNSNSPLVDLARREHMFAENFLFIVCNSTNLLRRNDQQKTRRAVKTSHSVCGPRPPRADNPVLSRSDSARKSVSWGDSGDSSIRSLLISRYMNLYWSHFGTSLYMMFYEPCWVRHKSLYFSELGSMLIQPTTVVALVKHMMQHVCLKVSLQAERQDSGSSQSGPLGLPRLLPGESQLLLDNLNVPMTQLAEEEPDLFPPASVGPMLNAVKKCLHVAAFGAWDTCLSEALASQLTDKCYPCPLVNGEYSTRTGMLLRDTYQPMLSLIREQLNEGSEPATKDAPIPTSVSHTVAVTTRLQVTSSAAHHWCRGKTHQFLASMSVANFLLISQTDLKMLIDETQNSLYRIQMVTKAMSKKNSDGDLDEGLEKVTHQLNIVLDSLQGLPALCMRQFSFNCTSTAREYFKANMPQAKVWRRKPDSDTPQDHNIYIEHALETILEPVLEGVAKLKQTTQLSVISRATEGLVQAWIAVILEEKIKFSHTGAYQLGMDVKYLKSWLHQSISNEAVNQSILDLAILKSLSGAVLLLLKQPTVKHSSSFFKDSTKVANMDMPDGAVDDYIQGERSIHESEDYISHVSNPQEWLALRVSGGGSRGWRSISSCLNSDS